ncbi:MAG: S-layer homology domain-containing protein, partial [Clostridia bacterium]|nr:S-layer homology domain-containing protein [Clostridia bacterium]
MNNNFFKSVVCVLLVCAMMSVTVFASGVVDYGVEYTNQPTQSYSQTFKDVNKNYWAFNYIEEMVSRGVLSGYPNGCYYPENYVTRAEFAKIMCVAAGLSINEVYSTSFADVSYDEWYAPYIETGKYYLSGYTSNGANYYHPDDIALREDIAVALVKLKGYSTVGADESILKAMFTDWQSISADARKYVAAALENGLVSGYEDNTFRGQDSITRAEAATLLWRAYQYGNGNKMFDNIPSAEENSFANTDASNINTDIETKLKLNLDIDKTNIIAQVGDTVEFNVTVGYNFLPENSTTTDNGEEGVLPNIKGDCDILSSTRGTSSVNSGNSTKTTYVTNILKAGNYTIDFWVEDDYKTTNKSVTITVNTPKASYSCDTLAKSSLSDTYMMSTMDNDNNIYYYDEKDEMIYKLNCKTKKKTKLVDINKLKYDDVAIVEKEVIKEVTKEVPKTVTKEIPKTVTKTAEKEIPVENDARIDEQADDNENITESVTNTITEDETEAVYETETVYETVTETVKEETVVGTYKNFHVNQIYYNTGNNTLLLAGSFYNYSSDTSLNDKYVRKQMIFKIDGTKTEFYADKIDIEDGIMGNFDDGRLIIACKWCSAGDGDSIYYIVNCDDFSSTTIKGDCPCTSSEKVRSIVINNGSDLFSALISYASVNQSKYSFSKNRWDKVTSAAADYMGVKDKCFYYWDLTKGKIAKSDLNGKIAYIDGIDTINDIDVKDFTNIPAHNYEISNR